MSKRICICGVQMKEGYSGGRYHAWIMGEAFALAGCEVLFWTNFEPGLASDFKDSPRHKSIRLHVDKSFENFPDGAFDWVVIVPDMGSPRVYYLSWLLLAARSNARIALLNFETPNWFNSVSRFNRDEALWDNWRFVSEYCNAVISSSEEGNYYAKEYYKQVPEDCQFVACPPSINSTLADIVEVERKRDQVLAITRFGGDDSAHKGGEDVIKALGPTFSGMTLALLVGKNGIDSDTSKRLRKASERWGITIRLLIGLTDREKFIEIKQSKLMLFFSSFEGFGYPPVEAQYCGTPCLAYDLPVLREISGDGIVYVNSGDRKGICNSIERIFGNTIDPDELRAGISSVATLASFAERLQVWSNTPKDQGSKIGIEDINVFTRELSRFKTYRKLKGWFGLKSKLQTLKQMKSI